MYSFASTLSSCQCWQVEFIFISIPDVLVFCFCQFLKWCISICRSSWCLLSFSASQLYCGKHCGEWEQWGAKVKWPILPLSVSVFLWTPTPVAPTFLKWKEPLFLAWIETLTQYLSFEFSQNVACLHEKRLLCLCMHSTRAHSCTCMHIFAIQNTTNA